MIENYIMHLLILIGIYIIFAITQNLTLGNLGLLSLGNVAFYGVGAYTSAILTSKGMPFLFALFFAMLLGGLSASLMTYLMRKLKGDYYAIGTLAFLFVVYSLFLNWTSLTRGPLGIAGISKPQIFGFIINTLLEYLIFVLIFTIITVVFFWLLLRSNYNLVIGSIRDNETASSMIGYNTFKIKMQVMFLVGMFSGLAGSLYAHYITFIDPSSFYMTEVILILIIIIVGGIGSIKGSVFGTFVLILIPEVLRFFDLPSSILGPMRQIFFSIILILIIWFRPKGIFGKVEL